MLLKAVFFFFLLSFFVFGYQFIFFLFRFGYLSIYDKVYTLASKIGKKDFNL